MNDGGSPPGGGGLDGGTAFDAGGRPEIGAFVYVMRSGTETDDQLFQPLSAWACEYGVSPAIWHDFYSWKHIMVDATGTVIQPDGLKPLDTSNTSYWMYDDSAAWSPTSGFGAPGSGQNIGAKRFVDYVYGHFPGAVPEITWRPAASDPSYQVENFSSWQPEFTLDQINAGAHDAYIAAYAQQVAADGRLILFRIFHECNGVNYPYTYNNPFQAQNSAFEPFGYGLPDAGYTNGDDTSCPNAPSGGYGKLALAFRRVVGIFRANGATNVRWVWNVGSGSTFTPPPSPDGGSATLPYPSLTAPRVWTGYYPGDDVVDYPAMDGYNRSAGAGWRDTVQIFGDAYAAISSLTNKPMQISEMASVEDPSDVSRKAAWITDAFGADASDAGPNSFPVRFPQIEQIVVFDHTSPKSVGTFLYSFDSSPQSKAAWEAVLASGLYALPGAPAGVCDGGGSP